MKWRNSVLPVVLLVASALAQTGPEPVPKNLSAAFQPDSPVQLTLENVYSLSESYRSLTLMLKNTSSSEIRGVVIGGGPEMEALPIIFQQLLHPGVERRHSGGNTKKSDERKERVITVDSVLFADGRLWGPDTTGGSNTMLGYVEGQKAAIAHVRKILERGDEAARIAALSTESYVAVTPYVESKGAKFTEGYRRGAGSLSWPVRFEVKQDGGLKRVETLVADMERSLGLMPPTASNRRLVGRVFEFNSPPVEILALKQGGRTIAFDEWFSAGPDWLRGFTVKLRNDSGRSIKFLSFTMQFPETTRTGSLMAYDLRHGWAVTLEVPPGRTVEAPIPPGADFELAMDEVTFDRLQKFLGERNPLVSLTRVNVQIQVIHFDDGTGWSLGPTRQDPNNPRRYIPVISDQQQTPKSSNP